MNPIKILYNDLADFKKTKVKTAWCAKMGLTERQFTNRLNDPKAIDYAFYSMVFNKSVDELIKPLLDKTSNSAFLKSDSENLASALLLTS